MIRPGIVFRLLAGLLLVALAPLIVLQQSLTERFANELRGNITSNLAAIADHKVAQINTIIDRQLNNAESLAKLPATVQIMRDANSAWLQEGPISQRYRELRRPYLEGIGKMALKPGFYDLLLITPNGDVVFSYQQEADLGTNLFTGPFRTSQLARIARQTLLVMDSGVSDLDWYAPSHGHAAFITAPVLEGTRVLGVLAIQVSPAEIQQMMRDNSGLGKTGTTILVQRVDDPPRIVSSIGTEADAGIFSDRLSQLAISQSTPLVHALAGEHGQGESDDYRQVPVLAAWRYVPSTRWGLVVELDKSEAFAPVRELENYALMLLFATLLLAAAIAYWMGRSIVRPVQVLTNAAAGIAGGNLHQRVPVLLDDEVGQLATAFNSMTDNLEFAQHALRDAHDSLEQKVEQRTEALQWEEQRMRTVLDNVLDGIIAFTEQGTIESFNKSAERIFGYAASEAIGMDIEVLIPEAFSVERDLERRKHTIGELKTLIGGGREVIAHRKDGGAFSLRISLSETHLGMRHIFVASVQDVSEIRRAEKTRRLYASVFEHSGEAMLISDSGNHILAVNPAFTALTGYTIDDLRGRNPRVLSSGKTSRQTYQDLWGALHREGFWQGETWNRGKDGRIYPNWMSVSVVRDPGGAITHYIVSYLDITERKAAEERIAHLAHHDALTGLLNRLSLRSRLEQALATAQREQRQLAVMFVDMDRFKTINDTLGHAVGDELLVDVARRLGEVVRNSDIVARLGGDEFVVVLAEVEGAPAVARVAEKILHSLGQPYQIGKHEVYSTPSIGVAFFPTDGNNSETLMKSADTAMYHAKSQGRNNVQFFAPEMNLLAVERLRLERHLRVALAEGQFELHYQPRLQGSTGQFVNVEALLRWRNPHDGLMLPDSFIPAAEETNLILPLGEWVIDEACRQLRAWRDQGLLGIGMTVNLSARQLHSPTLPSFIGNSLQRHGLTGADLELDIAESVLMDNPETSIGRLRELSEVGVRLSIDNFGTGYSSLNYLKQMPINSLKIDQSLVHDIEADTGNITLCNATIALAHNLGLSVVGEGVETEAQRDFLIEHRCDFMQGYLFSKPLPAAGALALIGKYLHCPCALRC